MMRLIGAAFVIVLGLTLSRSLGRASFFLAVFGWAGVLIGILYTGEALPWVDRLGFLRRLIRSYAPPQTEEERRQIRQRHYDVQERRLQEAKKKGEERLRQFQLKAADTSHDLPLVEPRSSRRPLLLTDAHRVDLPQPPLNASRRLARLTRERVR
jgi:hypothetical protein